MLQVKSFDISDHEGINKLLSTGQMAAGAHILVSEGKVCVPYEDGLPPNTAQLIVRTQEEKNVMISQLDVIIHSQKVNQKTIDGCEKQIATQKEKLATAEATYVEPKKGQKADQSANKASYIAKKEAEGEIARLENVIRQTGTTMLGNQSEVTRMTHNIQVYDETIAELKGEVGADSTTTTKA